MLPTRNNRLAPQLTSPILLGLIIDVSHSMRSSWPNRDGKKLPKIEIIRDVLNRKIREEQQRSQTQKGRLDNIDVFCLGFGFRYPFRIEHDILKIEQAQPLEGQEEIEVVDLICDLLALGEILPTREKLEDFKERLNQKWQQCTREIFDQATIAENVFVQISEYIETTMRESAMQRHQRGLRYNLARRFRWMARFLSEGLRNKEEQIRRTSRHAATQYTDAVFKQAYRDFANNQQEYVALIEYHLETFVEDYVAQTLQSLTLGFSTTEIVATLDEARTLALAKKIYADLDKKVKDHIKRVLANYYGKLVIAKQSISATLDMKHVEYLTRRFIQKQGWDYLMPLIKDTVYTLFTRQFEQQAKQSFSHWLRLASSCEVVRPLTTLSAILPNIFEDHLYSEQVMFGSTPFRQTLDRAAMRFIDEAYKEHRKILFIISDGEFRDEAKVMVSADLLKKRGVTIISGLIHERNLLEIMKCSSKEWPTGAKRMVEIASEPPEHNLSVSRRLARALLGGKLCYQINHSRLLAEIVENVLERPATSEDSVLHKPRDASVRRR